MRLKTQEKEQTKPAQPVKLRKIEWLVLAAAAFGLVIFIYLINNQPQLRYKISPEQLAAYLPSNERTGFYQPVRAEDGNLFVWSDGQSVIPAPLDLLVAPSKSDGGRGKELGITLELRNPNVAGGVDTPVSILVDKETVVTFNFNLKQAGFQTFYARVPYTTANPKIELKSNTFQYPGDKRILGVMVSGVTLERSGVWSGIGQRMGLFWLLPVLALLATGLYWLSKRYNSNLALYGAVIACASATAFLLLILVTITYIEVISPNIFLWWMLSGLYLMALFWVVTLLLPLKRTGSTVFYHLMLIITVVLCGHLFSAVQTPFDSIWTLHTATSLVKEGNLSLNEYSYIFEKMKPLQALTQANNNWYEGYPWGAAYIATPFVAILEALSIPVIAYGAFIQVLIGSILVATISIGLYFIGKMYLAPRYALLIAFIFAFCTSAWTTMSRGLWQHAPSALMLTLALYILLKAQEKPYLSQFAGLPLVFAYVCRPTDIIPLGLLSLYVLVRHWRYFIFYGLWSLLVAVPFVWINLVIFNAPLSPYYSGQAGEGFSTTDLWLKMLGQFISPGRGLLIFSPVILLSFVGIALKIKQKQFGLLDYFLVAIILLHWVLISLWVNWWGGYSLGPRLFADMLPFFIYFMLPAFVKFTTLRASWQKTAFALVATLLIFISFWVHMRGANDGFVISWNGARLDGSIAWIDQNPQRLWDWGDLPFFRDFKWFL